MPRLQSLLKREKAERARLAGTVEHLEEQLSNLQARTSRPAINGPSDKYDDAANLDGSDAPDWLR